MPTIEAPPELLEPDTSIPHDAAWNLAKVQYLNWRRATLAQMALQDRLFGIDSKKAIVIVICEK